MTINSDITNTKEIINLIGDENENFYQLGLKDAQTARLTISRIRDLLSTQYKPLNLLIHKSTTAFLSKIIVQDKAFESLLSAYAQAIDISSDELFEALLIPEICAFIGPWSKYISPVNFGCSSLFCLNDKGQPTHTRILDFPLKNTYDKHERIIVTKFKGKLKTFNYSCSGLPFSGLTSMNEKGLSIAIHQKFTKTFNQHGTPVFYIAHEIIQNCSTTDEALDYLKQQQSITCWNFNIMDSSGKVLEADLNGNQLVYNTYDLYEEKYIYICNEIIDKNIDQAEFIPAGMIDYNNQRKVNAKKLSKKIISKSDTTILKNIATPVNKDITSLSPITPSTMECVLFNNKTIETSYIPGEAPKLYQDEIHHISEIWDLQKIKVTKNKKEINIHEKDYYKELILSQHFFDISEPTDCYHHLQMAISKSKTFQEENLAKFFFIIAQYIFEPHLYALKNIQEELASIYPTLNSYFQDISCIIDQRISVLTSSKKLLNHSVNSEILKARLLQESTLNKVIHKSLRELTYLHIDILDVIFV